ncbi:lamin tail domain-containing protein [Kutzneria sp. CA-103260]|uniref:lamin tail domain-containing protein n=1 Tax=Kutzneria sp. CA-103260 TaxID=2802641 RepID=UPI001BA4635F|nr:lamin tail domain-containing protein [Kutzneria sp. CA-103260]QUQ66574.1 Lamin Tail Domain protein [Kutzneria sp. CA-103260]
MRRLLNGAAALVIAGLAVTAAGVPSATAATNTPATPKVSQTVVVNEVATVGPNGPLDEFVEVRNVNNSPMDLSGWQLRVYNAANRTVATIVVPAGIVLSPRDNIGQFLVLTGPTFGGTVADPTNVLPLAVPGTTVGIPDNGGVAMFNPSGIKTDGVSFSTTAITPREGTPATPQSQATAVLGASSARDILSTDTDNNRQDFSLHQRTPGAMN